MVDRIADPFGNVCLGTTVQKHLNYDCMAALGSQVKGQSAGPSVQVTTPCDKDLHNLVDELEVEWIQNWSTEW